MERRKSNILRHFNLALATVLALYIADVTYITGAGTINPDADEVLRAASIHFQDEQLELLEFNNGIDFVRQSTVANAIILDGKSGSHIIAECHESRHEGFRCGNFQLLEITTQ